MRVVAGILEGVEGVVIEIIPRKREEYSEQAVVRVTKKHRFASVGELLGIPLYDLEPLPTQPAEVRPIGGSNVDSDKASGRDGDDR